MAQLKLLGKIIIDAALTVETGLHIGASSDFAPIGAVDSPVIRDPFTKRPVIPGSSVKGKMRTLLAKVRDKELQQGYILPTHDKDDIVVKRLFGFAPTRGDDEAMPARLQFADSFVTDDSIERFSSLDTDTYFGEVKAENTINRNTGGAMPRSIERVPAGMEFGFRLVYNLEKAEEYEEDMNALAEGFRLLQMDYLGGNGSRGYGRVRFSRFKVQKMDAATGEVAEETTLAQRFEGAKI